MKIVFPAVLVASALTVSVASGQSTAAPQERVQESGSATDAATLSYPSKPRTRGFVRTWIMIPADQPAAMVGEAPEFKDKLQIVYTGGSSEATLLGRAAPYQRRGYTDLAPGKYTFRLLRVRDDSREELASSDVTLKAGSFVTLIVTQEEGRYKFTVADDTKSARQAPEREGAQPPPPPPKEIVFYNFVPSTTYKARSTDPAFEQEISFGTVERITPLPGKLLHVETTQTSAEGPGFSITTEADLQIYDSLSFVIIEDIYGRPVPAVIPNAVAD